MNIVICANCLWIGTEIELSVLPQVDSGSLGQMIKSNDLVLQVCPKCQNSKLFRKIAQVVIYPELEVAPVPLLEKSDTDINVLQMDLEDGELDSDIVADLLDSAERLSDESPPVKKPRRPAPSIRKFKCDACDKQFESKVETSRCNSCNDAFMKQYVK